MTNHLVQSHRPMCFWMTGLSGAGKTTLAYALRDQLNADGVTRLVVLDGDVMRAGLCKDLGFSEADRLENARRLAAISRTLIDSGLSVVVSTISPTHQFREIARSAFKKPTFLEVYVATPLSVCVERDVKGLYRRALNGQLPMLTGVGDLYEIPQSSDVQVVGYGNIDDALAEILFAAHLISMGKDCV